MALMVMIAITISCSFDGFFRGCSHITSAAGGGVSRMLTIADKGGKGQKNVQIREIMGTENVDKENN